MLTVCWEDNLNKLNILLFNLSKYLINLLRISIHNTYEMIINIRYIKTSSI